MCRPRQVLSGPAVFVLAVLATAPTRAACGTTPLADVAGGWLQVAQKTMPMSSLIIGIDLAPIKAIRGVHTIIGDITTQKARQVRFFPVLS